MCSLMVRRRSSKEWANLRRNGHSVNFSVVWAQYKNFVSCFYINNSGLAYPVCFFPHWRTNSIMTVQVKADEFWVELLFLQNVLSSLYLANIYLTPLLTNSWKRKSLQFNTSSSSPFTRNCKTSHSTSLDLSRRPLPKHNLMLDFFKYFFFSKKKQKTKHFQPLIHKESEQGMSPICFPSHISWTCTLGEPTKALCCTFYSPALLQLSGRSSIKAISMTLFFRVVTKAGTVPGFWVFGSKRDAVFDRDSVFDSSGKTL